MNWSLCAAVFVGATLVTPLSAQTTNSLRGGISESFDAKMADILARQERVGRRVTSAICDGCNPGKRTVNRRIHPLGIAGEDGLAYRPEDLR